ncbi:MAG: hypothetical protein KDH88_06460 [Chromatiales bacterium]|nr:hypothetical protein [Chromatiales bacterium]
MSKIISLFILLGMFSGASHGGVVEHYRIDFGSPPHTVGGTPATGSGPDTVSAVVFGQPVVAASYGPQLDETLVFNPDLETMQQIRLDLNRGYDNYRIGFDLVTDALAGSDYNFAVLLDTDVTDTKSLNFHGSVGVRTFNPTQAPLDRARILGPLSDGTLVHVEVEVDLLDNSWTASSTAFAGFSGSFDPVGTDLSSIRFSIAPWTGSTPDPTVFAAIDNIVVSSSTAPVVPTAWLLLVGLAGLLRYRYS